MKYQPIKIVDPLTDGRLVKLHHEQKIHLTITNKLSENLSVDFNGDTLAIEEMYKDDFGYHYLVSHKTPLEHHGWDGISKFFIGEITIVSKLVAASLCVILENGSNNIIVSNPQCSYLRFEPHHTIEVISPVNHAVEEGLDGLGLVVECLSERFNGIAYNYVFKLNNESLDRLRFTEKGLYDGGRIYFDDKILNLCISHRRSHILPACHPQKKRPQIHLPFYQQAELHKISSSIEEGCKIIWID